MKTIRITGKGQIKVHPDVTRITMTLEKRYQEYAKAVEQSAQDTERLKTILEDHGFDRKDIKTLCFDVDTVYENRKKDGEYRQYLAGYRYRHVLKAEFPPDRKRLGDILYTLTSGPLCPEIRISYTVGDPEAVKNTLLGRAVADAMEKARILADAAGAGLGEIQTMDYSWGRVDLEVSSIPNALPTVADNAILKSIDVDIEPDDIEASDTVTIIWELC